MEVQAARLAKKAKAYGYRWLALEWDDYGNAARWPVFRDHCRAQGLLAGTWVTDGQKLAFSPLDADFVIAEDEGPSDRQGILESLPHLPNVPKAIIGNGWHTPSSKSELAPVVAADFHYLTEMYARTDDGTPTNYTPESLAFNAHHNLGFPMSKIQPCFGIFGGATPSTYLPWYPTYPGWSHYVIENTLINA